MARLAHLALLTTPLLFFGMAIILVSTTETSTVAPAVLSRYSSLGLGALLVATAAFLRNTLPRREAGQSEDAWWHLHLPRAVMLWALAEAVGLAGVVMSIVSADLLGAVPLVTASTLLLLHLAPGRLARE